MSKWSPLNKLLQTHISTVVTAILCIIAFVNIFAYYGLYNYEHVPIENIPANLYRDVNPSILKKSIPNCKYEHLLQNTKFIEPWQIPKKFDDFSARGIINGSFVPEQCNPLFSVAILITYRNRQSQLDIFLPYIHNFLRKQNIHYKIYLIEQQDEKPWNKGVLYNIGAKQAIADKFPCLILHDVDLLPLTESNLYICMQQPRHVSASIDKFRYVLPYKTLVGGVLAIRSDQYTQLNGMSNRFVGWGGEDDDFSARITSHKLDVLRFPREMSKYTMLVHRQEAKNVNREQIVADNKKHFSEDGLSSLRHQPVQVKAHRLFTMIGVKL